MAVNELSVDELAVDELSADELAVDEFSPHRFRFNLVKLFFCHRVTFCLYIGVTIMPLRPSELNGRLNEASTLGIFYNFIK